MIKRAAVFGGAGFIGTNLVNRLINEDRQVYNFDNLSGLGNLLNIADLLKQSRHAFARCDAGKPEEAKQALLMAAVDTIFLCISLKGSTPERNNVETFRRFFDVVLEWRNQLPAPHAPGLKILTVVSELHESFGGSRALFDAFSELLREFRDRGLPLITLFSPRSFGPYQQPDSPIPLTIYRAIEGESIPVVDPEKPAGDLIHVSDVIEALRMIEDQGEIGACYEVEGFRPQLTNLEIADTICDELNKLLPPPIGRYQALIDEITTETPRLSDLRLDETMLSSLGLKSKTDMVSALRDTVRWYLKNPGWYRQSRTRYFDLWQNPTKVLQLEA